MPLTFGEARSPISHVAAVAAMSAVGALLIRYDVGLGPAQIQELKLAYLHLVPRGEWRLMNGFAVDVGAVEAADVADKIAAIPAVELCVPAADGHVIEENVVVWLSPDGENRLVKYESVTRVRPALYDQERRPRGKCLDRVGVGLHGPIGKCLQ